MNREWKKELKSLYPAPPPLERDSFLRRLPDPGLSLWEFLWRQAGYIRKGNWLLAIGLLLTVLLAGSYINETVMRVLAASTPFLALTMAAEGNRSIRFGMEELELSSRFPLRTVVAARLGIMGGGDLLLLGGAVPLLLMRKGFSLWLSALSLLIPYLLAAFLNLLVVRKYEGNGSIYFCMGIAVLISGLCVLSSQGRLGMTGIFLNPEKDFYLAACALLLAALTGWEYVKIIRQSEEYRWSLQ